MRIMPPYTRLQRWTVRLWTGCLVVGLCAVFGIIGYSRDGYAQDLSDQVKDVLKEIERLDGKTAPPHIRPAAGEPQIEEVAEAEEAKPSILTATGGLTELSDYAKLSPAQQKLVASYDNFIALFPDHPKVPELLYNAGSTYFDVERYPNARMVYERILNQHPQSGPWYVKALSNIVESYRREKDYKNLEVWSERLRTDPNTPDSLKDDAEKLAAGAIANQANELARQSAEAGDLEMMVRAAEEYIRTARTYPNAEFAAISLYNAGYTYKKAEIYDKAAEVWLDLVERYPSVSYADTAVWEAALAYDQLKDYPKAIGVYRQFVANYPKSEFRADALKNLIYDYNELEEWPNSATIYEQYATEFPEDAGVERFYHVGQYWLRAKEIDRAAEAFDRFARDNPQNEKVKQVPFELGQAWIKAGNLARANEAFDRFATLNPGNPLSVKIHYDVGEFHFERNQWAEAKAKYEDTIAASLDLEKKGLDSNAYYRGEAYMRLASMTAPSFEEIRLTLPKATFEANLARKTELGKQLQEYYQGVILSGSIKGAEAAYKLSDTFVHMADTWLNQERPPPSNEIMKRVEEIKTLNADAIAYLTEALKPLETVNLKRGDEYVVITYDTTWTTTRDSILSITPVDSSENEWVVRARDRVAELSLRIADLTAEPYEYFLDNFYQVPTPPLPKEARALGPIGETIFKKQVWDQGLVVAENQIQQDVLPAYQNTLNYSKPPPDGYALRGPAMDKARERALELALKPVLLNEQRIPDMLNRFDAELTRFVSLTDSLMYRPENIRDTFAFGDLLYAILDGQTLPTYIDLSLDISRQMAMKYENVIQIAGAMGIEGALVDTLKTKMVRLYYNTGQRFHDFARRAEQIKNRYYNRVAQIDSIISAGGSLAGIFTNAEATVVLNDMLTAPGGWEDIDFNLRNSALEVYETGYGFREIYPLENNLYRQIRTRLTALDPNLYPPPTEDFRFTIATDGTWMISTSESPNWTMGGFVADATWHEARMGTYPVPIGGLPGLRNSMAMPIWGASPDTSGMGGDAVIYTRKEFDLYGKPDSAVVVVAATAPFEVFVNGFSVGKVETVDVNNPQTFDVTANLLGASRNAVGVQVVGSSTEPHSVIVEIRGVDKVVETAENLDEARQHYGQFPDES